MQQARTVPVHKHGPISLRHGLTGLDQNQVAARRDLDGRQLPLLLAGALEVAGDEVPAAQAGGRGPGVVQLDPVRGLLRDGARQGGGGRGGEELVDLDARGPGGRRGGARRGGRRRRRGGGGGGRARRGGRGYCGFGLGMECARRVVTGCCKQHAAASGVVHLHTPQLRARMPWDATHLSIAGVDTKRESASVPGQHAHEHVAAQRRTSPGTGGKAAAHPTSSANTITLARSMVSQEYCASLLRDFFLSISSRENKPNACSACWFTAGLDPTLAGSCSAARPRIGQEMR